MSQMVHRVNFVTCSSSTSRFEELFRFRRSKFGFGLHPAVSFNKPGYQSINLGIYADFGRSMFQESQTKSHFHDFHDDIRLYRISLRVYNLVISFFSKKDRFHIKIIHIFVWSWFHRMTALSGLSFIFCRYMAILNILDHYEIFRAPRKSLVANKGDKIDMSIIYININTICNLERITTCHILIIM